MTKNDHSSPWRFVSWLGSPACFRVILGLLMLQAAWIALSGRYPMAFDEDFHLGIIRLYAHHISPFWNNQPPGAEQFGAVARDPSYLYQYLMSFPYRFITLFTGDQTLQVLWLRAINIGLFAGALALYRRLLLKTGASRALVQSCLLLFVLIPVVPLLAAQINYDNLFLPVVALSLLLALGFDEQLGKRRLDLKRLLQLLIVCVLGSLVKYAFLPVFAVLAVFVAARVWQHRHVLPRPRFGLAAAWRRLSRSARWGLVGGLIVAAGLFGQRYGVNVAKYHTPIPDCGQVLSTEDCREYGPWIRDYNFQLNKLDTDAPKGSPLTFTADWFYGMWLRLFFAVDGPATDFQTRGPLFVPGIGSLVFAALGALAVLAALPKLFKKHGTPVMWLFIGLSLVYLGTLWLDEYRAFLRTGQPVAINGRYLFPVLPFLFLIVALAVNELLKRRTALKLALASAAVLCLLWGGGTLTYILRSSDSWYWPNQTVYGANHAVKRALGPLTPGYRKPTQFMH